MKTRTKILKPVTLSVSNKCHPELVEGLLWDVSRSSQFFAIITSIAILFLLNSCQSKLTKAELLDYIQNPENGLTQQKKINNVTYKVTYKPTALMIKQELRNKAVTNDLLDSLKEKYEKYLYFMLSVNINNRDILSSKAGDKGEFGNAVYQLSFNMNEKTFLVTDQLDTLGLVDYVFPRMYGMSPSTNMLFVFEKGDWNETVSIKLHLNEFGLNTGNTKYKFLRKDIDNIPNIKYE